MSHKKGVYIESHECEDVVKHRESFLKTVHDLQVSHRPPPLCSDEPPRIRQEEDDDKKELVVIYYDESIFNTNEGQTWMWGEEEPAILPKTKGSGIMVSDFVEEHGGFLRLSDKEFLHAKERYPSIVPEARRLLEYGADKEGYWTGERFMDQVKNAASIADIKYGGSGYTVVWLFDQSSCHRKFSDDALQAKNILVKDGGPQRVRDTV